MSIVDNFLHVWRRESRRLPYYWNQLVWSKLQFYGAMLRENFINMRESKLVRVSFVLISLPCLLLILFQIEPVKVKIGQYWGSSRAMASTSVRSVIGVGGVDDRLMDLEMRYDSDRAVSEKMKASIEDLGTKVKALETQNQLMYAQFVASSSGVEKLAAEMDHQIGEMVKLVEEVKANKGSSGVITGSGSSTGVSGGATKDMTSSSISPSVGVGSTINGKVNINTADKSALMTLTGVGESKAQAILDYRTSNGPFKTIEELDNVKGIGPAMIEDLKDQITL